MDTDKSIHLPVDSKGRVVLSKLLPKIRISSVRAYQQDNKIILEPMVEIPANEVWLYKDSTSYKKVKEGLQQKGTISRGSFVKYVKEEE